MQQVKLFKSVESNVSALEEEINGWLMSNNVQIVSIVGNIAPQSVAGKDTAASIKGFAPSDLFVMLLYERM